MTGEVKRVVIVTGAGSGIGAAICRRLAAPGLAFVVHTRKNEAGARHTAQAVLAAGGEAEVVLGDMADPALPGALVARAVERFGALDVVVANAGFADKTPLLAADDARAAASIDPILWGFLRLARAAAPAMRARPAPRIVAISSFVAHVFRNDVTLFPLSAAAKAGVEALVRSLAVELAAERITVNAVVPGFTRKDPTGHTAFDPKQWEAVIARIPLGRLGLPDDVAEAVAYLASPAASYVTGQALHVNGGLV